MKKSILFSLLFALPFWGRAQQALSCDSITLIPVTKTLNGIDNYDAGLKCAAKAGKPVLIYFSGNSATNCTLMENILLSDPEIAAYINNHYILINLVVDDFTPLKQNKAMPAKVNGKDIKTIGQKNRWIEDSAYQSNTIPYFVVTDNKGQKIDDLSGFDRDKSRFLEFLINSRKKWRQ